ncbi:MAG TPA: hypothetical protein VKU41_24075 [Polyangiaceae bacterium]|nr:hypothetical protein [Polyangiaceae bacterium]
MDLLVGAWDIGLALAAAGGLVGCSGNSANLQTTCGPGTTVVGGQCVVVGDAGSASGSADSAAGESASGAMGGVGTDGSVGGGDTGAPPASDDGGSSAPDGSANHPPTTDAGPSDPCYASMTFMNCDSSCADKPSTWCPQSTCGKMVTALAEPGAPIAYVRTPPAPGVDPACSAACASGGFVYGVGVQVSGGGFVVKAPPPWQIIANSQTPFCPDAHSTTSSCAYFPTNATGTLYLVTHDPNAPARNIQFDDAVSNPCP